MKYHLKTVLLSGVVLLGLGGCLVSPVGPSTLPSLSGCYPPAIPTQTIPWPCGAYNQVVILNRSELLAQVCTDPSQPDPCDFSTQMLIGLKVIHGCQQPISSFPTICYYPNKVVLTEQETWPATPPTFQCYSIIQGEVWLVVPNSSLPLSINAVTITNPVPLPNN